MKATWSCRGDIVMDHLVVSSEVEHRDCWEIQERDSEPEESMTSSQSGSFLLIVNFALYSDEIGHFTKMKGVLNP